MMLLLVWLLGCQDAGEPAAPQTDLELSAARARRVFESQVVGAAMVDADNPRGYLPKTVRWHEALPVQLSMGQGLTVPVHYDEPVHIGSAILGQQRVAASAETHLLVYKGEDGQLHFELVSTLPTHEAEDRFTGIVAVDDWYGHPLTRYQYKADGTVQRLKTAGDRAAANGLMQTVEICYYRTGYNYSEGDPDGYYYEILIGCQTFVIDTGSDGGSPGGGTNPGGGGTTPPGSGNPCDRLIAARQQPPAGCPDNPPGPQPTPPAPPKKIINKVTDPCPKIMIGRLTGSQSYLQSVFGANAKVQIEYRQANLGFIDRLDAVTTASVSGGVITIITTLNSDRLKNATDQFVMATLVHEMYHAQEIAAGSHTSELQDHIYMAGDIDALAVKTQSFFPGMSLSDARDLCWGGLGDTPAFQALSAAEQSRIRTLNLDYLYGAKGDTCY